MQIDTTVHLSHARSKLMHILLTMVLVMAPFFTDIAIADDFSGIQNQLSTQKNTQSGKKISGVVSPLKEPKSVLLPILMENLHLLFHLTFLTLSLHLSA